MKIAICGTAATRAAAPFSDPTWEIWASNDFQIPRWDRWFELHNQPYIKGIAPHLWAWMAAQDTSRPIYMRAPHPEIPASKAYPRAKIVNRFFPPPFESEAGWAFSSTIAWAIGLAISLKPSAIALYGVEMADDTEYAAQKPGCRFMVRKAREAGIEVIAPPGCEVMSPVPVYGLDDPHYLLPKIRARIAEFEGRAAEIRRMQRMLEVRALLVQGELTGFDQAEALGLNPILTLARRTEIKEQLASITGHQAQLDIEAHQTAGALFDQDYILKNWTK